MIDPRTFEQIRADHPMPWGFATLPGVYGGSARIVCIDAMRQEVPLSVLLRVVDIVTSKAAEQRPQPPTNPA